MREQKEIFFMHSKSQASEAAVVSGCSNLLTKYQYSVWDYDDWDWEHETSETRSSNRGGTLDMRRIIANHPKPFKRILRDEEVDSDALESIFKSSKIIVFINPVGRRASKGVHEEIKLIRSTYGLRGPSHRYILCLINDIDKDRIINFAKFSDLVRVRISEKPRFEDIVNLSASIAIQLLELSINQKEEELKNPNGIFSIKFKIEEDISRSRELLMSLESKQFNSKYVDKLKLTINRAERLLRPSKGESPLNATQLVDDFSSSVQYQVMRFKEGSSVYKPYEPSPTEWRGFWVEVFEDLCESLYRIVALHNTEVTPSYRAHHEFLTSNDREMTRQSFESFCMQTEINHILDWDVATYILSDCIVGLAGLVREIVGREVESSFQYRRITNILHIKSHILVRENCWKGDQRDNLLDAMVNVPFPIDRYFCMSSGWKCT